MASYSEIVSDWVCGVGYHDLPEAVVRSTELRVLDIIGLAIAGLGAQFGRSVRESARALHGGGPSRIFGAGDQLTVTGAAFANGALSQALEFDDTHNKSIVHMSGPAVATAFALADAIPLNGRDVIVAIAIGNEISCRVGCVSPSQFHRRGFHPTGLFATFGTTWLAARLMGLRAGEMTNAAGIAEASHPGCCSAGSTARSRNSCTPAMPRKAASRPPASRAQGSPDRPRFSKAASAFSIRTSKITRRLGIGAASTANSARVGKVKTLHSSPFPFPMSSIPISTRFFACGRVTRSSLGPLAELSVRCRLTWSASSANPSKRSAGRAPDSHGRVSLQYTLAEAMVRGRIGKDAFQQEFLADPEILHIAGAVEYRVDQDFPGPEKFKGEVTIFMKDGRSWTEIEDHNRGSSANPMTESEVIAKFEENASDILTAPQIDALADAALSLRDVASAEQITNLTIAGGQRDAHR